ncbi:MAG: hypothetical protein AB2689_21730 [Candidatus Thiodiazotropha taylori]
MSELPDHGQLNCRICFESDSPIIRPHSKWIVRNDPGSWGSKTPDIVVLGFSKGATQSDIYQNGSFDDVAFGSDETRRNLTNILRRAKLLLPSETSDEKIREAEEEFSFGSLVRCSCARLDEKESARKGRDVYKTSGQLIVKSFSEIPKIIDNCSKMYLVDLPSSVKLVCFLGVTDAYIKNCKSLMRSLYPNGFKEINGIAYKTNQFLCVHLTHPSKGNGTIDAWLNTDVANPTESTRKIASAKKREMAINTIEENSLARS